MTLDILPALIALLPVTLMVHPSKKMDGGSNLYYYKSAETPPSNKYVCFYLISDCSDLTLAINDTEYKTGA